MLPYTKIRLNQQFIVWTGADAKICMLESIPMDCSLTPTLNVIEKPVDQYTEWDKLAIEQVRREKNITS